MRTPLLAREIAVISSVVGVHACTTIPPTAALRLAPQAATDVHIDSTPVPTAYLDSATAIAGAELRAALGGRRTRGIEDVILRIENTLPGFGGMYMDDTKTIVVYAPATVSADTVRAVLAKLAPTLDVDPDSRSRLLAQHVRVVTAHFPFSMLVAWETMFGKYVPHDLGVASMDADEQTNTVHIGIMSPAMMTKTLQFAHDIGIPLSAMTITQQNRALF